MFRPPSTRRFLLSHGLTALLLVLAWLFADKLARLALARPQEPVFESRNEARTWLGLVFSIDSVPD